MTKTTERGGLYLFRSRDGLQWELVPGLPAPFLCDTHNQVFYDARRSHYAAFLRAFPRLGGPNRNKRCVARTEMTDLLQMPWPHKPSSQNKPEGEYDYPYIQDEMPIVMAADKDDPPRTDLYNPAVHLYPYAEDVYVAFPSMYRNFDHMPSYGRDLRGIGSNTGLFETQLAVSRDGHTFQRFREPYVRSGFIRDRKGFEGELDCGMIMMGIGMIRSGDRLFQYYYGSGRLHGGASVAEENAFPGSAVFRAVQRLDGFVSLDTDHTGGEILTPKLKFAGNRLYLNADCAGLGEIWVEIQDADGTAFPGYSMDEAVSIDRNGTAQEIWWKNGPDAGGLAGQPVRLRFRMRSAKLYAFQFT